MGVVLAIVFVIFGFQFVSQRFTSADELTAEGVQVTNITDSAATITFNTSRVAQCLTQYGPDATALSFFAEDTTQVVSHSIQLSLLSAQTQYYFTVQCDDVTTTNQGIPYTFTTAATGATGGSPVVQPVITSVPLAAPTTVVAAPTSVPAVPTYCSDVAAMRAHGASDNSWTPEACVSECSTSDESRTLPCAAAFNSN